MFDIKIGSDLYVKRVIVVLNKDDEAKMIKWRDMLMSNMDVLRNKDASELYVFLDDILDS
ncbi:hypothetical protein [uncultured Methanolobus sp.]|uniref:hypothetical protein n=1 Tax=uncultured Methanolobus sp. TaxID=218300 RepID=UPI002AAA91E8|nr:hypothetical protein [uncultured Methanolobus sp.]